MAPHSTAFLLNSGSLCPGYLGVILTDFDDGILIYEMHSCRVTCYVKWTVTEDHNGRDRFLQAKEVIADSNGRAFYSRGELCR